MPRKRPGRVRTKHDNGRPPLLLSAIKPQNISLREGEIRSIVCPDCETWRRLMGETQLKIRKHCAKDCTGCTIKAAPNRKVHTDCPGTDQPVTLNISIDQWAQRMLAADSTATGRRSARQHYKPLAQPSAPVYRLADGGPQGTPTLHRLLPLLERARRDIDRHHIGCFLCRAGGRCQTGRALEVRAAETQASCTIAREQLHRQEHEQGGRSAAPTRRSQWAAVLPAVRDADTRRTSVPVPPGRAEAPAKAGTASVPTEPENLEAHDQRQAELGKQYAQRKSSVALPA
ncbi:hypothetical protein AB0N79_35460 [Streptomyces microflavus]|uniref:hypothetical protein n=1 Tax=Streptomyces microflavus TaxID=1919 RepID=UPI003441BAFE